MVRKICLDSDIIIDLLNKKKQTIDILSNFDAHFITTSINPFELFQGKKRGENVIELMHSLEVFEFNRSTSLIAGNISKALRKKGNELEIRDIFIASICIANDVELLTGNQKHFDRLKQFGLVLI